MKVSEKIVLAILLITLTPIYAQNLKNSNKVYNATWESVEKKDVPQWFLDAKFGIYFHWGPYSVPAYKTEWYSHYMYDKEHEIHKYHREKYGSLNEFGYKDFIPMFTAENFDAEAWVRLFQKAGARFVGPVTEHADGFAMWDSELTKWDAKDMGPKKDIVGEIMNAVRKTDLKFITTFHHQWLWSWYSTWDNTTDAYREEYRELYGPKLPGSQFVGSEEVPTYMANQEFAEKWLAKVKEVINKYQPDLIYFDNKLNILEEKVRLDFLQYYYNFADSLKQEVVVTYKAKDLREGSGVLDLERARMRTKKDFPWLTDDSIDWASWCHVMHPDYKSTNRIIDFLVDVVSKNGNVLLNITPTAQGSIPQPVVERLLEIGNWLDINGEAIYGTRPFIIYGEGPQKIVEGHLTERQNEEATNKDIRFTTKGDILYAIVLDWPENEVSITSLGKQSKYLKKNIDKIELLGTDFVLKWEQHSDRLTIKTPIKRIGNFAHCFKITTK